MANAALSAWYTQFLAAVANLNKADNSYSKAVADLEKSAGTKDKTGTAKTALGDAIQQVNGLRATLVGILSSITNSGNVEPILSAFDAIKLVIGRRGLTGSSVLNLTKWAEKYIKPLI